MSRAIIDLHPALREPCAEHLKRALLDEVLMRKRLAPELDDTAREDSAQLAAWQKGRDEKGNVIDPRAVVTNSRPGQSWHAVHYPDGTPAALAYHVRLRDAQARLVGFPGGAPMDDEAYLRIGKIGEDLGLLWGGRWKQPHDPCHYELHPNGATLAQVLAVIKEQGDIHGLVSA